MPPVPIGHIAATGATGGKFTSYAYVVLQNRLFTMIRNVNTPAEPELLKSKQLADLFKGLCFCFGDAAERLSECELMRLCNYAKGECPAVDFTEYIDGDKVWQTVLDNAKHSIAEGIYHEWHMSDFEASDPFDYPENPDEDDEYVPKVGVMSFTRTFDNLKVITITYHPEGVSESDPNWKWTFDISVSQRLNDKMLPFALYAHGEGWPVEMIDNVYRLSRQ